VPTADSRTSATQQFEIADTRSAAEVSQLISRLGYEPVWKDWEPTLSGTAN
jgi:2-iminoacetate synthase